MMEGLKTLVKLHCTLTTISFHQDCCTRARATKGHSTSVYTPNNLLLKALNIFASHDSLLLGINIQTWSVYASHAWYFIELHSILEDSRRFIRSEMTLRTSYVDHRLKSIKLRNVSHISIYVYVV